MKMQKRGDSSVSFFDTSNGATVPDVEAPNQTTQKTELQMPRLHWYEVFLAGFVASAILAFVEQSFPLILFGYFGIGLYSGDINLLVFILANPGLIFSILYFWGNRRIVIYFREKYLRISVLLFLGSAIGFAVTQQLLLFALGAKAAFPTFLSLMFTVLAFILTAVGSAFTVTFVGLAAFALARFRHSQEL
jgi:hypothetical protein